MRSRLGRLTLRASFATLYVVQTCFAQNKAEPVFDAVSVKISQIDTGELAQTDKGLVRPAYRSFHYTPGRVTCTLPLISIIQEAYGVRLWQISGPAWLYDGAYDLAAVMPPDTSKEQIRQMHAFADWLVSTIPRPVIDMTGLPGNYNIDIKWTPDFMDFSDVNATDMGLISAIETQLGLKFIPAKLPYNILAIDDAKRIPKEN